MKKEERPQRRKYAKEYKVLLRRLSRKEEPQGQNGTEMHREWEY
jgi:hypothetical protein